jgi:hypothetical protein
MKNLLVRPPSSRGLSASLVLASALLLTAHFAAAPIRFAPVAVAPSLGGAQSFAVLGASTVTNVVSLGTAVTGNLGVSPNPSLISVTGFPPGEVFAGAIHLNDGLAIAAQTGLLRITA